MKAFILLWLCFACFTARAAEPAPSVLCTEAPTKCVPFAAGDQRYDARVQRLLAERRLAGQSLRPDALYLYFPLDISDDIKEQQIRFLYELLAAERAKARAASDK